MKKVLFLLAFCAPMSLAAQISVAPVAGFNVSGYTFDSKLLTSMDRHGVKAGIMLDIKCSNHFHVQPGANYAMNGFKMMAKTFEGVATVTIHTLEIPLNATFKTREIGDGQFFVSAGPYAAINLRGTLSVPIFTKVGNRTGDVVVPLSFGNNPAFDAMRILDLGLNANAGYELPNGLFARVYYQQGLRDLGGSTYSYNYGFGVCYLIGKNVHRTTPKKEKKEKKLSKFRTPYELQENE